MNTVVGLGDDATLEGFALAGVRIVVASSAEQIAAAWGDLDESVGLVILSSRAADVLAPRLEERPNRLTVVMP